MNCRSRLQPPILPTYFGNCITAKNTFAKTKSLLSFDGIIVALEAISEAMKNLGKDGALSGVENSVLRLLALRGGNNRVISTAGSNRFEVYGIDFRWGMPKKVEISSRDRTVAISLSESRSGKGGLEVGLALTKPKMEAFAACFVNDLVYYISNY